METVHEVCLQYEHELETTELQHEQWRRDSEILHIQEIQHMERDVHEKFTVLIKNNEIEMRQLRETANDQFSSLIKSQQDQILQLTDIHQKTLIENERTIAALRTELKATRGRRSPKGSSITGTKTTYQGNDSVLTRDGGCKQVIVERGG
ncbi:hypothetical protein A0J61_10219 [Choanephora cucurbitarum]|uniref:Uncharacterized protein n=1 Tax=Choanephora cucurbitarum TaxID=101091 RepID=A0A1C7MY36_9FUNG|nr:hypothetical protein A0J61_10219 [Choanephora cucurbitarum]